MSDASKTGRAAKRVRRGHAFNAFLPHAKDDPLTFVQGAFLWNQGELEGHSGPDTWQADVLRAVAEHNASGSTEALRIAAASGHGVGKSALIAWLILWAMTTRPHLAGVITANTERQLATKTWRELALWHRRALNRDQFTWTASKFASVEHPETWFVAAVPWSKERPEAFAGLHAQHIFLAFDEASAIPEPIWEVAEGAMTTPGALWFAFGNPTRTTGRFRECFGRFRHRWKAIQVDARTSKLASRSQIDQWIADYGEDSDFVRVRVRGEFPRASSAQFIASDVVAAARARAPERRDAPLVLGIDVARFGDDETAFVFRRGDALDGVVRLRGLDTMQTAGRAADAIRTRDPAAVFVDGIGVGAGVVDRLRQLGFAVIDVNAAGAAADPQRYANKRAEMWGRMRDWLAAGGCLPADDAALAEELAGPEYGFDSGNRILLERKDDMKRRGLASPDTADALALTFAEPVAARPWWKEPEPRHQTMKDWDPFSW
ncbi:MAG TPA: terminase [Alphaproteobacteria bacterium]|nr:terminase [Alphaproteobacteria bacterium]